MSIVKLVQVTPDSEKMMIEIARVSNPKNQKNPDYAGLLNYCIKNEHWSVFEQSYLTIEINTSIAIATQILRHRSFTFQQFSQRYANIEELVSEIPVPALRRQADKDRQDSIDNLDSDLIENASREIEEHFKRALELYQSLIKQGVAKESARFVLPQSTPTRLYMTGSCRSWIHYLKLRCGNGTQREHMEVALGCKNVFIENYPVVADALKWSV